MARLEHADYRTGLVWEHFLTGRGAAGSGGWSVVRFDPTTYRVRQEGARPLPAFFTTILGRTVCFDVPSVSLASSGDAVAVTGWRAHDPAYPRASAPPGLLTEVDDAVGDIVAALPTDTTIVVFSPHGAGTNDADVASMVLLPELLHRRAFGRPFLEGPDQSEWAARGRPPVVPDVDVPWHEYTQRHLPAPPEPGRPRSPRDLLRSRLPRPVLNAYRATRDRLRSQSEPSPPPRLGALGIPIPEETAASPEEIGVPAHSLSWQLACRYEPMWPLMTAFAIPTFYDGRVRINLEGRESQGLVRRQDYLAACKEIEDAVRACRDPRTGEPVVAEIVRLRDDDPLDPDGPDADLQVIWSHAIDALEHPEAGIIGPFPFRRTGGHRSGGFALVTGPGIGPVDLGRQDALAVPATVAALAGGDTDGFEAGPLPGIA